MLFLKVLHKWVITFLLFATISGFSGINTYNAYLKNPTTEVIVSKNDSDNLTVNYCNVQTYTTQQVTINKYTIFNFKSLLNWCLLDFSLTLKTQKQKTFEFLETNSILKQNLIAYTNTTPIHASFVK